MKALLIADDDNVIEKIKSTLINDGFDVITYKWLLKALDNVEEISPDVIVVQASSYPRHWKTLVQFSKSGISGFVPKIILYSENNLTDEEFQKSQILGINGIFNSINEDELKKLSSFLSGENNKDCSFIFTNPDNGAFVTGNVINFENNIITFIPDSKKIVSTLKKDTKINQATIKMNKSIKYVTAKIIEKNNNEFKIQVI
mgnify:FL=1